MIVRRTELWNTLLQYIYDSPKYQKVEKSRKVSAERSPFCLGNRTNPRISKTMNVREKSSQPESHRARVNGIVPGVCSLRCCVSQPLIGSKCVAQATQAMFLAQRARLELLRLVLSVVSRTGRSNKGADRCRQVGAG